MLLLDDKEHGYFFALEAAFPIRCHAKDRIHKQLILPVACCGKIAPIFFT